MAKKLYEENDIQNIANAIREKNGSSDTYKVNEMATAIRNIEGGGSSNKLLDGHYDTEGLKQIGWTDEEIQYYQDNGVKWFKEQDYLFKLNEQELLGDDTSNTRFIPKNSSKKRFKDYKKLLAIPNIDTNNVTSMYNMFTNCSSLTIIPQLDTSNVTDMNNMFNNCYSLRTIPQLDTSNVTNMSNMFSNCSSLTTIPQLDTSKVTTIRNMFYNCNSLTIIPQLDTSKITDISYMFNNCYSLTTIPNIDTSNVTSMYNMFYGCYSLTTIPQLDTSKVTDMGTMFRSCNSLTTIPQLDTSKVTKMSFMFDGCSSLTTIPQLDTSNVTDMNNMFYSCNSLTTIPQLDTSKVTNLNNMFGTFYSLSLENLGGFNNLGKGYTKKSSNYSYYTLDLSKSTKLTYDSLMNVINKLYDLNLTYDVANGGTLYTQKLTLGSTNVAKLTAEEIQIATDKGWTVS